MGRGAELKLLLMMWVTALSQTGILATLVVRQGRVVSGPQGLVDLIPVIGLATVELDSDLVYIFDCITDLNNGSGLVWARVSAQHRFQVETIPDGTPGKRLEAVRISYSDLDVYVCSDRYSSDVVSINITGSNPAIMAADPDGRVEVVQGSTAHLEVYVSGYPTPTASQITWRRPGGSEVVDSDENVDFQEGKRILVVTNVRPHQAGVYVCTVALSSLIGAMATTKMQLEVYVSPSFITQPQEITDALEWTEVRLTCSTLAIPVALIEWERENGEQLSVSSRTTFTSSGNVSCNELVFTMVRYDDRGRYRCVADNFQTNKTVSEYADVRVTPALIVTDDRSRQITGGLLRVEDLSQVAVECLGTGNLEWTSSTGFEISQDESDDVHQSYDPTRDALSLVIRNFTDFYAATYTCRTDLVDGYGRSISRSWLITSANPSVFIQSSVQYVLDGNSTTIEAAVYAFPYDLVEVQWYHETRLIDASNGSQSGYMADVDGDIHRLLIDRVSEDDLGEYVIVVSLNGSANASDEVILKFLDPPSANISSSRLSFTEGDRVSLLCRAEGVGPLTIDWDMANSNSLPSGVQQNGSELFIASITRFHAGTYTCSVGNPAGIDQDNVTIAVYYAPTAFINYNGTHSTPEQHLQLVFDDGGPAPTILCSADGHLPPNITWVRGSDSVLPDDVTQELIQRGDQLEVHLRWKRPIRFTDSGTYSCRVSNNVGNDEAALEVLVNLAPAIITIYANSSIIKRDTQTLTYTVPLGFIESALVCVAQGWPAPKVEWRREGQLLPSDSGIVSESITTFATVTAILRWTRKLLSSDAGNYECLVRKPDTLSPTPLQVISLRVAISNSSVGSMSCDYEGSLSVFFQLRVLGTNCERWEEEGTNSAITEKFEEDLLTITQTQCNCEVGERDLAIVGPLECSRKIARAAVFRGQIQTALSTQTRLIYCALFEWQRGSPLIRVNGELVAVDSSCPFRASSSSSEECVIPEVRQSRSGLPIVGAIASGVIGAFLLIFLLETVFCCVYMYYYKHYSCARNKR